MKRTLLALAIGAISVGIAGGVVAEETESDAELNGDSEMEQQDTEQGATDEMEEATEAQTEDSPDQGDTDEQNELDGGQGESEALDTDDEAETTEEQTEEGAGQGDTEALDSEEEIETTEEDPGQADAGMEEDSENPLDESLGSMQVSELEGMTVVNQEEEEIGEVQSVAKQDASGELFVVITVGGFWGIGGDDIALPLQDMQVQDDQLLMQTPYGEDEIKESAETYDEDSYSEVDGEMTLSDAWGQ